MNIIGCSQVAHRFCRFPLAVFSNSKYCTCSNTALSVALGSTLLRWYPEAAMDPAGNTESVVQRLRGSENAVALMGDALCTEIKPALKVAADLTHEITERVA